MDARGNPAWLVLAWLWLLVMLGYMAWGMAAEAGLYGRLIEWQLERWGYYYPKLTAVLPALLLASPALWYVRRHTLLTQAMDIAEGPAAVARRMVRNAMLMTAGGAAALAVAAGAYLLSQQVPADNGPPVEFDAARLGTVPAPTGRVRIRGEVDPDAATAIERTDSWRQTVDHFVAFVPDGADAKSAGDAMPYRLFVERTSPDAATAATTQMFLPEQDGWLEENGLPELARRDLESRGIRLAAPHYVLHTGSREPRAAYYITAGIAGLVGLGFLVVGLVALVQARARLRRAQAG